MLVRLVKNRLIEVIPYIYTHLVAFLASIALSKYASTEFKTFFFINILK